MNHEINHDSGERNIHPDGKGNAGQPTMLFAIIFEGVKEGHEDQRDHYDSEQHMWNEDRQIKSFDPSKIREDRTAVMIMVSEIAHEENA